MPVNKRRQAVGDCLLRVVRAAKLLRRNCQVLGGAAEVSQVALAQMENELSDVCSALLLQARSSFMLHVVHSRLDNSRARFLAHQRQTA